LSAQYEITLGTSGKRYFATRFGKDILQLYQYPYLNSPDRVKEDTGQFKVRWFDIMNFFHHSYSTTNGSNVILSDLTLSDLTLESATVTSGEIGCWDVLLDRYGDYYL
jgi:hypothetical protein